MGIHLGTTYTVVAATEDSQPRILTNAGNQQLTAPSSLSQRKQPKIVAAIPCYNTERSIGDIVTRAKKHVDQVIVVNDGSSDNTGEVAQAAGASVIKHQLRGGAGAATQTGFEVARRSNADVLVTVDGDGQHNPEEIPLFITPILKGEADLVIGSRFLNRPTDVPRYRKFGIGIITFLLNFGSRVKVSDSQSCFRAYSKKALQFLNITENGFGFSVQLLIQARRKGLAIAEVPVSCSYNSDSHSLNPLIHGLGVALNVVRLRLKRRRPPCVKRKLVLSP